MLMVITRLLFLYEGAKKWLGKPFIENLKLIIINFLLSQRHVLQENWQKIKEKFSHDI